MQPEISKAEARAKLKSLERTVTVKTLDGDKVYNFVLLKRKAAARVFHNTLLVLASAFAELAKSGAKIKPEDILKALNTIDFDTVWGLAEILLADVIIDNDEIDLEEYYGDNPSEIYIAIWHGIQVNYPKVFTMIREKITGSDLSEKVKDLIPK